jgi:hypothetical protein
LFGGFGLQKPVPKQEQESEISPLVRNGDQQQSKKPQTKLTERLKKNQSDKLVNRLRREHPTEESSVTNTQSRLHGAKSSQTKLINNLKN